MRASEFICIVGASGSGKTTLLRAAAGLLPLTRGEVLLFGERVVGPQGCSGDLSGLREGAFALASRIRQRIASA
ncbi:MAG TPA: ATP-binding cassette domain-containing protein [Xanthobacteraceae bacterium]|nr:ATP-binding cassette domain-containing protein [Xanthobacteraceae bacterium]